MGVQACCKQDPMETSPTAGVQLMFWHGAHQDPKMKKRHASKRVQLLLFGCDELRNAYIEYRIRGLILLKILAIFIRRLHEYNCDDIYRATLGRVSSYIYISGLQASPLHINTSCMLDNHVHYTSLVCHRMVASSAKSTPHLLQRLLALPPFTMFVNPLSSAMNAPYSPRHRQWHARRRLVRYKSSRHLAPIQDLGRVPIFWSLIVYLPFVYVAIEMFGMNKSQNSFNLRLVADFNSHATGCWRIFHL